MKVRFMKFKVRFKYIQKLDETMPFQGMEREGDLDQSDIASLIEDHINAIKPGKSKLLGIESFEFERMP